MRKGGWQLLLGSVGATVALVPRAPPAALTAPYLLYRCSHTLWGSITTRSSM